MHSIDAEDFSGKPSYQSLANEYIEPPIRIRYKPVTIDGQRVGVFEIGDSQDRPYMMRIDYSEALRRGDVFVSRLRLCIGEDLCDKRFGLRYALHGQNLRSPAKGQLRLLFGN